MSEGVGLMHRAEEAAYDLVVEVVRTFRLAGWSEDRIREDFGGSLFDGFKHTLDPAAYADARAKLERALEETR